MSTFGVRIWPRAHQKSFCRGQRSRRDENWRRVLWTRTALLEWQFFWCSRPLEFSQYLKYFSLYCCNVWCDTNEVQIKKRGGVYCLADNIHTFKKEKKFLVKGEIEWKKIKMKNTSNIKGITMNAWKVHLNLRSFKKYNVYNLDLFKFF